MNLHRPLREALLTAWQATFSENQHAEKVLERLLKSRRQFGSRDRRFVAENFYDGVRWWRALVEKVTGRWQDVGLELSVANYEDILECLLEAKASGPLSEYFAHSRRATAQAIPDWLDEVGERELGEKWEPLLKAMNVQAPVYLRANLLKNNRQELMAILANEGIQTVEVENVPTAVRLTERKNVFQTEAYRKGRFEMQDAGSQLIAPFTQAKPKQRVIDACAGAGGKSLHLAEMMRNSGRIISMDVYEWKLKELRERASRAGSDNIETRLIESTKDIKKHSGSADVVLLDVPCSGMGVLRRHPDTKWKLTCEELKATGELQTDILARYTVMVKPGGLVTYATCSVFPSENAERVKEFLAAHPEFQLEDELHVSPIETDFDGFYAARLRRQ